MNATSLDFRKPQMNKPLAPESVSSFALASTLDDPSLPTSLEEALQEVIALRRVAAAAERTKHELALLRKDRRLRLTWIDEGLEEEKLRTAVPLVARLVEEENGRRISRLANDRGNLVIEADNIDALRLLSKTHSGAVDCIYIDPPYNTGSTSFVYNDRFVSTEHKCRNSLWLDFMQVRLKLAKTLLSPKGVILVSINDENRAILELLMDQIFEGMKLGSIVWRTRQGANDSTDKAEATLSINHEHVLVYANKGFRFGGTAKTFDMYRFDDHDGRGIYRISDMTVSVRHDDKRAGNAYYPIQDPATGVWYPGNPDRVWAYARSRADLKPGQKIKTRTMDEFIADNKVRFPLGARVETWATMEELLAAIDAGDVPLNGKGVPLLRRGLPDLEFFVGKPVGWGIPQFKRHKADVKVQSQPLSSWLYSSVDKDLATAEAINLQGDSFLMELTTSLGTEAEGHLKAIFGEKVFNYAKPPSLITGLLRQATTETSLVLDFFAGSGTTAEAVLRLNEEDGGSRRFIMVSSTEATDKEPEKNLCRDVTARRVAAVVDGYGSGKKAVEGAGDGFAYLRLVRCDGSLTGDSFYDYEDARDPATTWTMLQLLHRRPITAFNPEAPLMESRDEDLTVLYAANLTDATLAQIKSTTVRPTVLYTGWNVLAGRALEDRPVTVLADITVLEELFQ